MKTWCGGYLKIHDGCGGTVRYVEALGPSYNPFYLECLKCKKSVINEEVLIIDRYVETPFGTISKDEFKILLKKIDDGFEKIRAQM